MTKLHTREKPIYGNCRVLSFEGITMFLCIEKKANWYLDRNLAEKISENPLTIKLNFKTKGFGSAEDEYALGEKANCCVVCGCDDFNILTKHHVVPHCYRKYMPDVIKSKNSYDILPVCFECHQIYEISYAAELKKELAEKFNAPVDGYSIYKDYKLKKAVENAKTILKYGEKIPFHKKEILVDCIKSFLKKEVVTLNDLTNLCGKYTIKENFISHGELVMSQIKDIQNFVEMWREHFVNTMKPKFLPKKWHTKRTAERVDCLRKTK